MREERKRRRRSKASVERERERGRMEDAECVAAELEKGGFMRGLFSLV